MTDTYVSPATLFRQLGAAQAPIIIDVRGAEEYAAGHLPGALCTSPRIRWRSACTKSHAAGLW